MSYVPAHRAGLPGEEGLWAGSAGAAFPIGRISITGKLVRVLLDIWYDEHYENASNGKPIRIAGLFSQYARFDRSIPETSDDAKTEGYFTGTVSHR